MENDHTRKTEEKLSKLFSKTDLACINAHTNMNLYINTDVKMLMSEKTEDYTAYYAHTTMIYDTDFNFTFLSSFISICG